MTHKIAVQTLPLGEHTVLLELHDQTPVVEYKEQTFKHLWLLVDQVKELSDPKNLEIFAIISNFFWKGTDYQCIHSIASYQKEYVERVDYERKFPADVFEYRLTDYKIFDVSVMHEPLIEDDQIIYFVYNLKNGLPYRVVSPFPYTAPSSLVHYQILPVLG
jgi:hypothetical protein